MHAVQAEVPVDSSLYLPATQAVHATDDVAPTGVPDLPTLQRAHAGGMQLAQDAANAFF